MDNSEKSAFPIEDMAQVFDKGSSSYRYMLAQRGGFTKREYCAIMLVKECPVSYRPANILQGIKWALGLPYKGCQRPIAQIVKRSLELTDELFKQLNQE